MRMIEALEKIADPDYDAAVGNLSPEKAIVKASLLLQSLIPMINRNQIGYISIIENKNSEASMVIDALTMLVGKKLPDSKDDLAWTEYRKKQRLIDEIERVLRLDIVALILKKCDHSEYE